MPTESSPRVLIARLSHIGDCIHAFPLAHALRERFPAAHLAWVVERPAEQLVRLHPAVDETIVLPKRWYRSPTETLRAARAVGQRRFDVSIDPQSLTKTALLAKWSGASQRIGFAQGQGRELAPWLNNVRVPARAAHVVDRYLELLRPLGIERPQVDFTIRRDAAAVRAMRQFVLGAHLSGGFAVINPGAGWPSRLWPTQRFGIVARHLGEVRGVPSVAVWAGEAEREMAGEIVARSAGHAILAPATNLVELAALLSMARIFVGADTGPLHLAAAMGAPCVSLHGATLAAVSGAYGDEHLLLQERYQGRASRKRRGAGNEAMQAIEVEAVCAACDELLSRPSARTLAA